MSVPIYVEQDVIPYKDITFATVQGLYEAGVELYCDGDIKAVRILWDTSEHCHERCGEPLDSLEVIG